MDFETELIHACKVDDAFSGATQIPVFQTSAFSHKTAGELEGIFSGKSPGFAYSRIGNPTVNYFEQKICRLEGGLSATACASGSAAIASAVLNIVKTGDEIIIPTGLYGGTLDFFRDLSAFGVKAVTVENFTAEEIEKHINDRTKIIFAETIGNPKLNVIDIEAIAGTAGKHEVPLIIDNTTATPVLVRPFRLGANIVIHSASKYINGHGTAIGGVIVDGGKFNWNNGKYDVLGDYLKFRGAAFTARLRNDVWRNIGACLAPVHAFLNLQGIETLDLRMRKICENALKLAEALSEYGGVNYPALSCKELCTKQFTDGMAGGILTLRTGSKEKAFRCLDRLETARNASNIGDVRTLVLHPASTIFSHSSKEEQEAAGVYDDLIRISVGIESAQDLINDFRQALED